MYAVIERLTRLEQTLEKACTKVDELNAILREDENGHQSVLSRLGVVERWQQGWQDLCSRIKFEILKWAVILALVILASGALARFLKLP